MSLIALAYLALPNRYHFRPDWEEAAVNVLIASVIIAAASTHWWRKITFWLSLLISSTIHLLIVHAWINRVSTLMGRGYRADGKLAVLLGLVLFFVVYGCGWLVGQNFYGRESGQ
jgi:hypothetical protein